MNESTYYINNKLLSNKKYKKIANDIILNCICGSKSFNISFDGLLKNNGHNFKSVDDYINKLAIQLYIYHTELIKFYNNCKINKNNESFCFDEEYNNFIYNNINIITEYIPLTNCLREDFTLFINNFIDIPLLKQKS